MYTFELVSGINGKELKNEQVTFGDKGHSHHGHEEVNELHVGGVGGLE